MSDESARNTERQSGKVDGSGSVAQSGGVATGEGGVAAGGNVGDVTVTHSTGTSTDVFKYFVLAMVVIVGLLATAVVVVVVILAQGNDGEGGLPPAKPAGSATATAVSTNTPQPTVTLKATDITQPTASPTLAVSATPRQTGTTQPTALPSPSVSATPRPTDTQEPTATATSRPAVIGPVMYDHHTLANGGADASLNCGDTVRLKVALHNTGTDTAKGVNAAVSTNDPFVTWIDNTLTCGDIAGGEVQCYDWIEITVAANTPDGHVTYFELDTDASNGGPWTDSFSETVACGRAGVVGPLVYAGRTIIDDPNGNGQVDCGETVVMYIDLYNEGSETAIEPSVFIDLRSSYYLIEPNDSFYPDIPGGQTRSSLYEFYLEPLDDAPTGHVIDFGLSINASNGGQWTDSFNETVVCRSPSITNFQVPTGRINKQGCGSPETAMIRADITADPGVAWVRLYYQLPGESWTHTNMTEESGGSYSATIGPFSQAGTISYYVWAQDGVDNQNQTGTHTVVIDDCNN